MPRLSIVLNALVAGALTMVHFESLVELEMMLYAVLHVLFLYAFVALRVLRPQAERPFRLPGGTIVAAACCVPPLLICVATLGANLLTPAYAATFAIALLLGLVGHAVGWWLLRRRRARAAEGGAPPEGNEFSSTRR